MSARSRSPRKNAVGTTSHTEPASSGDEGEDGELSESTRGGGELEGNSKASTQLTKTKGKAAEVDSGDEGDEDDQPRKKARQSRTGKQGKQKQTKGKLEIFKTLPVEMVTEIFSHLYPNDLLALSMVNKQYRALVTTKSSSGLWKAARNKLELPDLVTDYFSESQYASLIFGRNCQLCNIGFVGPIEPRLRVRYCQICRGQQIVKLSALKRTHPEVLRKLHPRAKKVVLKSRGCVLFNDLYRATVILRDLDVQNKDVDEYVVARSARLKEILQDEDRIYLAWIRAMVHPMATGDKPRRKVLHRANGSSQASLFYESAGNVGALGPRDRQEDLRPLYDELLESTPRSARPFVPLFLDFLVLPSVKALWVGDGVVTKKSWEEALDGVKEDLKQFRLDLVSHAHSLVRETTTDPTGELFALAADEPSADLDKFFSLATSFVCCDVKYCKGQGNGLGARFKGRTFGPLVDVLKHLHTYHNYGSSLHEFPQQGSFHICRPSSIVDGVRALLEGAELDPATAGVAALKRAGEGAHVYEWQNRPSHGQCRFGGTAAWYDLLCAVKEEGDALAHLDPPVVVKHRVRNDGVRLPEAYDLQDPLKAGE